MIRFESPIPNAPERRFRPAEEQRLAARALGRFLLCGSWTSTSATLVRALGGSADAPPIALALTRAAAAWHGARAAINRTLEQGSGRERTVALADVLVEARETLGSWDLVYALLARHAASPAGQALEPALVDGALTLASAWYPAETSDTNAVRHAA